MRLYRYAVTVFISSAALLILEIVAGRLIAPYVGVSLYTWTSIIGVILAGLSLGNWLGGVWADRGGGERAVGIALVAAGFASIAVLLLLRLLAPLIQQSGFDLLSASFFYVLGLFFLPAVLLGIVTPLLTTLALRLDRRSGRVVGRMHALAALGSILGTFLTGFVLVQYFGTRNIIVATGVLLLLLSLPYFRGSRGRATAVTLCTLPVLLLTVITYQLQGFASPCQYESHYFCIRVVDDTQSAGASTGAGGGAGVEGEIKTLVLDHMVHGSNHATVPELLLAPYVHLSDRLVFDYFGADAMPGLRYFFIGGGAYSHPRALQAVYPQAQITVAELDPMVTAVARRHLFLDPRGMNIIHRDARVVLRQQPEAAYDVVIGDAFHDVSVPYHLLTREFIQLARSRMTAQGLFIINIVDLFPNPYLVKSAYKTLAAEFAQVDVWLESIPPQSARMTFIVSASDGYRPPPLIRSDSGLRRQWYRITEPLLQTSTTLAQLPLLSDDYVPVERLLSRLLFGTAGL
jgi:predicted membrane-bound spermidine synthase